MTDQQPDPADRTAWFTPDEYSVGSQIDDQGALTPCIRFREGGQLVRLPLHRDHDAGVLRPTLRACTTDPRSHSTRRHAMTTTDRRTGRGHPRDATTGHERGTRPVTRTRPQLEGFC